MKKIIRSGPKNIFRKALDKLKNTTFYSSLKLFLSKPQNILFMILADLIFIAVITLLNIGFGYSFRHLASMPVIVLVALLNVLILILAYSMIKLKILNILYSYADKKPLKIADLKKFYLINILINFILVIVNLIPTYIFSYLLKPGYSKIATIAVVIIAAIVVYIFTTILHLVFCSRKQIKVSFDYAWKALSKKWTYMPIVIAAMITLIYMGVFSVISLGVTFLLFKLGQSMTILKIYGLVLSILTASILYFLFLFSRVYYLKLVIKKIK